MDKKPDWGKVSRPAIDTLIDWDKYPDDAIRQMNINQELSVNAQNIVIISDRIKAMESGSIGGDADMAYEKAISGGDEQNNEYTLKVLHEELERAKEVRELLQRLKGIQRLMLFEDVEKKQDGEWPVARGQQPDSQ